MIKTKDDDWDLGDIMRVINIGFPPSENPSSKPFWSGIDLSSGTSKSPTGIQVSHAIFLCMPYWPQTSQLAAFSWDDYGTPEIWWASGSTEGLPGITEMSMCVAGFGEMS